MTEAYQPLDGHLPRALAELEHVCHEAGYRLTLIDKPSQQLVRIDHKGRFLFAGIGRIQNYPLNSATAASVARDKGFTYQVLRAAGLAVPPYAVVFLDPSRVRLRGPGQERSDAYTFARGFGYPVFVKPLDGALGAFAGPAFSDDDLNRALDAITLRHHAALIQPLFSGAEWRLFLVDGAARFAYRRDPPALVGDGARTVAELLVERRDAAEGLGLSLPAIDAPAIRDALEKRGLTAASVLRKGEAFTVSSPANLALGGTLAEFTAAPPTAWADWGREVMKALGLRVGAIDFFVQGDDLVLLEVNHTPDLSGIIAAGHAPVARAIWRDVLATCFAEAELRAR